MSKQQAEIVLHHIRRMSPPSVSGPAHDRQLLERFVVRQEEAAFAALLDRYGATVLRVCRRILHDAHEAEDAFQATFLILARKAGTIRQHQSLGSWLYRVAYHVAVRARADATRRNELAARLTCRPAIDPLAEVSGRELMQVLDDELQRLPEKYRAPLLLCYLEGHTQDEAARQLGWSSQTLRGRVERGRTLLRRRLVRRGFGLSVALMGTLLEQGNTPAAVPNIVLARTLRAAVNPSLDPAAFVSTHVAALTKSGINAFGAAKQKLAVCLFLLMGVLAGGLGFAGLRISAEKAPPAQADAPPTQAKDTDKTTAKKKVDDYGDPLPPGATARMGTIRLRQDDVVYVLAFSPDGKTLASGGECWSDEDRGINLWDISTGKLLHPFLGRGLAIHHLAFSPDGKMLASAGGDKNIRLWDVATGKEVRRLSTADLVLAFSPDGRRLATTYPHEKGQSITIWDTTTGKELLRLRGNKDLAASLTFAPNGKVLASASDGPNLTLWDVAAGKEIRRIEIGKARPFWRPIAFTPDGKRLAAGYSDNSIRLWDVVSGEEVRSFRGHKRQAVRLAFSNDGKTMTSVAEDRTVRIWDAASGQERRAIPFAAGGFLFNCVALSPGEKMLAVARDNTIRLWSLDDGKELLPAGHTSPVNALAFSQDGKAVTSVSWDSTFRRWDAATGREVRRSDGLKALLLCVPLLPKIQENGGSAPFMIYATGLSSDGRLLATGEGDKDASIHLWDVASGKEIRSFASHTGDVIALAFAPDGRVVASGSWDKTVRLWDVATGKELRRFTGHTGSIHCVCFSADGRWLASGGEDRTVRVWEVATGKELYRLQHETSVFTVAFAPDGRTLAAAGGQYANEKPGYTGIVLWEMASGKERRRLAGPGWVVGAIAFSPDGRALASGGTDGIVRVWEPFTGGERGRFVGRQGLVKSLAFSGDGRRVASGGSDTTTLIWDMDRLPLPTLRGGQLTKDERDSIRQDLTGADAVRAYRAMARLAASPDAADLLKEHLRPIAPVDAKKIAQWITDLDSDTFAVREQAAAELAKLSDRAEPALRQALDKSPSLEMRRRIEALLDKLLPISPQLLFALRAVEVLERAGTPQAREILRDLATGDPGARLTREAKASLNRLSHRSP